MSSMVPNRSGSNTPSSLAGFWQNPATTQKLFALGLLIASLAVGGYGIVLALRGSEQVLYQDLSEREAAQAVERLTAAGIYGRLGSDGRSVRVGSGDIQAARLVLASEGLSSSDNVGFELFDETSFGMTDFLEQVNYRRALEGELARTITALDEVAKARVHLVLPKESIYADKSDPAKASVSLQLHRRMQSKSVQAVVQLVASAVEGLQSENVVVVDSGGRTLHAAGGDPSDDVLTGEQLALKSRIEKQLADKAIGILQPMLGDGRVRARASVDIDFDRSEETIESFDPSGSVVRSQRKDEQLQTNGDGLVARGIPGTRSNPGVDGTIPTDTAADTATDPAADTATDPAADTAADPATDTAAEPATARVTSIDPNVIVTKTSETINYEVSKRVRRVSTPTGKIIRRSVAVVVDHVAEGGTGEPGPHRAEDIQKFRQLVIAALGLNLDAGDVVTVENIAFEAPPTIPPAPEPTPWDQAQPFLQPLKRHGGWLAVLAGFYLFMFRPLMRKLSEPIEVPAVVAELPPVATYDAVPPAPPAYQPLSLSNANLPASGLVDQAQEMSQQSPEAASSLIRDWLDGDRES